MATEQTIDTINNTNLKTVGENTAFAIAQKQDNDISHAARTDKLVEISMQNMITHQQRLNSISESYVGGLLEKSNTVDPVEAVATAKLFKGEADSSIMSFLAPLAAGQVSAKIAQSTAPETAVHQQMMNASLLPALAQVWAKLAQSSNPQTGNTPL